MSRGTTSHTQATKESEPVRRINAPKEYDARSAVEEEYEMWLSAEEAEQKLDLQELRSSHPHSDPAGKSPTLFVYCSP